MLGSLLNRLDNSGFKKYFRNTSWLFFEKIIKISVGLFVTIWIARYLGPEYFGLLTYAESFVGLLAVVAKLGVDQIVIRELVKNPKNKDSIIGTAFILKLIGATFLIVLVVYVHKYFSDSVFENLLIFLIALAQLFTAFHVVDFYFQSQVKSKFTVVVRTFGLVVGSSIKIFLIVNEYELIWFALAALFQSLVTSLGFIFIYRVKVDKLSNLTFKLGMARELLSNSWPLILSGIALAVYMKIDQIMIGNMLSNEAVGQYAVAARVSEVWFFLPMIICSSLFPAIINSKKLGAKRYSQRLQSLYDLVVWIAILIALPMTFASDLIINTLYGSEYNESADVLKIHIWSGVFAFVGVAFSKYLISENLQLKNFFRTLVGAVSNIVLNLILIPIHGIEGAAIATLLAHVFANYVYDIFDFKMHGQLLMKLKVFFPVHWFQSKQGK